MAAPRRPRPLALALLAWRVCCTAGSQPFAPSISTPLVGIFPTLQDPGYLAAYQKWVEQFGVRTVVLPAEGDADDVFSKRWPLPSSPGSNSTDRWARLNGMLIPGGVGNVSALARGLLLRAVKANSEGEYWPVWGTCLGFEWIVQVFGGDAALQSGFDAVDERMDISLTQVSERRRMLAFANVSVLRWMTHDNVTYEDHVNGIEPERFMQSPGLTAEFDILATSRDRTGRPYVAMIQGKRLPFYAVQFHPEKIRYVENGRYQHNIPKSDEARCVADDLAEFFASELQRGIAMGGSHENAVVV